MRPTTAGTQPCRVTQTISCACRAPRRQWGTFSGPLGDFKPIAQRPASVEDRREAGHWEGDMASPHGVNLVNVVCVSALWVRGGSLP